MNLKKIIERIIPAYRTKDAIIDELHNLSVSIADLNNKIVDLDNKNEYLFFLLNHTENETDLETKMRVFLDLPKADGVIYDFQIVANYILRRVKKICEENGLSFFLDGGTLLGAVRQHGFIPWDDDVDIGVMRSDYIRLFDIINNDSELEMHRYYRYSKNGEDPGYVAKIKLRRSETFFVDVFPFDEVFIDPSRIEEAWEKSVQISDEFHKKLSEVFASYQVSKDCFIPTSFKMMDDDVIILENEYLKRCTDIFLQKDSLESYIWHGIEQIPTVRRMSKVLPTNVFLPYRYNEGLFEGERYSILNNSPKYLTALYGNYMSFPRAIRQVHGEELNEISVSDMAIISKIKSTD